jgi:predicted ferric reductase
MKKLFYTFVLLNLAIIFSFWFLRLGDVTALSTAEWLIAVGRITGLLAVFSILMQFLLMGRATWMEQAFGLDKLAKIHKKTGYASLIFILAHPINIVAGYAMASKIDLLEQYTLFLSDPSLLQAAIAVSLFLTVVVSSIYIVRNKIKYEWWYAVHLLTYGAVILSWTHQLQYGSDFVRNPRMVAYWYSLYAFVFGQIAVFRFALPVWRTLRHQFTVSKVVPESDDVTSVYITGKQMQNFPARAGQFVKVRFFSGLRWLESHPFSISAVPDASGFRLSIKALGDFTGQIRTLKKVAKVFVEGPYGTFTAKKSTKSKVLCIAGGIGITPIRALIEEFGVIGKSVTLLYANKTFAEAVFTDELAQLAEKFDLKVIYVCSKDPGFKGESGRIDSEKIKRLVKDVQQRDVYICGPAPMMTAVRGELRTLGVRDDQVHFEEFAL